MPATMKPMQTGLRFTRPFFLSASLLITAALGGCASGDFGRTRSNALSDDAHRWLGVEATASVGLASSQFQLTDNERLMRDLGFQIIEPPKSRPLWKSVFGDYKPLPAPWRQTPVFDRTAYGRLLIDEPHRSSMSRYNELIDDIRDDLTRFEPFCSVAARVSELDAKRNASLKLVSALSPRERADAIARMDENALIVQWVDQSLQRHVSSYRWALERLVIQTPDNVAGNVDTLIGELAKLSCGVAGPAQPVRPGVVLRVGG